MHYVIVLIERSQPPGSFKGGGSISVYFLFITLAFADTVLLAALKFQSNNPLMLNKTYDVIKNMNDNKKWLSYLN